MKQKSGKILVPAHTFPKVTRIDPVLEMAFLDPDRLEKLLNQDPAALRHEKTADKRIVITASTADLQRFIIAHLEDEKHSAIWATGREFPGKHRVYQTDEQRSHALWVTRMT